ncbi:DUF805 domain-containing protein [Candidatus Gracilibacteria bacterium]|nr:DUF805 domain-containing protein [Candidatus Gracilibacteria bacterium]
MKICSECAEKILKSAKICPECDSVIEQKILCPFCIEETFENSNNCPHCNSFLQKSISCPECAEKIFGNSENCPYCDSEVKRLEINNTSHNYNIEVGKRREGLFARVKNNNRIGRLDCFLASFMWGILSLCIAFLLTFIFFPRISTHDAGDTIGILTFLINIYPNIYLLRKRFHDLNYSGWMYLFTFIPIVNIILGLILLFGKGTDGENQYGPDPLR